MTHKPRRPGAADPARYEAFVKLDTGAHTADIRQIAVTADGNTLVSAGECTIRVWDLRTGRLQRMLLGQVADRAEEKYGNGDVQRFALSPDGRWLIALKSWNHLTQVAGDTTWFTAVEVFELATGNLQAGFRYPGLLLDLDFSPDGRLVAMAGNACSGKVRRAIVKVYATRELLSGGFGQEPRRVATLVVAQGRLKDELPAAVRFIPASPQREAACRLVVAAPASLAWYAGSAAQGLRLERSIATEVAIEPSTLAVSADFTVVAAAPHGRRGAKVWQFLCHDHQGAPVGRVRTEARPAALAFSRDGRRLLASFRVAEPEAGLPPGNGDQTVPVNAYETAPGGVELRSTYYGHDGNVSALAWLDNGSAVSAGGDNQALHFWNPAHRVGEFTVAIRGVGPTYCAPGIDAAENVLFGTVPQRLRPPRHPPRQQRFDLRTLTLHTASPSEIDVYDGESDKWSLLALDPVQTLPLRCNQGAMDMDAPPDLTLFVGTDDEWVLWSRSGYYAASPNGAQRVGYHVNRGPDREALFFTSDRFKAFDRADLIRAIVEHGSEDAARAHGVAIPPVDVARMLPPVVEFAPRGVVVGPDHVRLTFTVEALSPDQPVTRLWILRNDRFVWSEPRPLARRRATYTVKPWLAPGRNVFTILAETGVAKSMPLVHELWNAEAPGTAGLEASQPGTLYLLSVGVSDFAAAGTPEAGGFKPLKCPHLDAIAIYNAFGTSTRSSKIDKRKPLRNLAFAAVEASLLLNADATKAAILRELDRLCTLIGERDRARDGRGAGRDVLMVFLSGHGVRISGGQDLYFWNHDLHPIKSRIAETGLSMLDLGDLMTSVNAEVALVVDACHAGMAGGNVVGGLDADELARRIQAVNERGMYVLSAARSEELADEDAVGGQGVFTAAILGALASERYLVPEAPGSRRHAIGMLGLMAGIQALVPFYTAQARRHAGRPVNVQTPVCRTYGDLLPLTIYRQ